MHVLSAFQVCSFLVQCPLQSGGVKNVAVHRVTGVLVASDEKHKVADGREISMDRVAKPTTISPQGFEPTPREPGAQCLSLQCHDDISIWPCNFSAFKVTSYERSGRSGLPDHPWGSNP